MSASGWIIYLPIIRHSHYFCSIYLKPPLHFFKHFIYLILLLLLFLNTVKNLFHLSRVGETLQRTHRHSTLLNSAVLSRTHLF